MQAISGFGEPPNAFLVDADAEAARQLTRALTMTKAGSTVSWEETLKTLGLDVSKEAERVNLQQQFKKDWEDVVLDSTKRKRRKKMKKHKCV
jgi:endonuclease I